MGGGRLALAFAWGIVALAFVLPVGSMIVRSFQVREVRTVDGETYRAVGEVDVGPDVVVFAVQSAPDADRIPVRLSRETVAEVRTVYSLDHYRVILGDARTRGLVWHSILVASGAVLFALLLGLPLAWLLGRTALPGRRVLAALCLGPAILPPLIVTMGAARPLGAAVHAVTGFTDEALQLTTAMVVFGCVMFPLVALLVGRALAAVPAGPWEAALLLGGRRAAFRRVTLPAIVPAIVGASVLVFVLALSDFAVPNVLSFTLADVNTPAHVFPTEILLQWKHQGNTGRAVATGAPLLLVTAALLAFALVSFRRSPLIAGGEGRRSRPRRRLSSRGILLGWLLAGAVLALALVLPLAGIASWGLGAGETVGAATDAPRTGGSALFDFSGALENTPGWKDDMSRWLKSAVVAALLAMAVAVPLARWALRGGRFARLTVLFVGAAPLAVPGLVFTVGTLHLWIRLDVGWVERGVLRSVLVLTARFLPFALLAAWLALREIRRGHEEAASLLGAGPGTRATRVWGPLAGRGILAGGLVVLVLALREIDAIILVDPRIFPMRLFDKIHFSRLADEANLAFLYVGILLLPALAGALFLGLRGRRPRL
ncbi:MAG: ABC transporter permease [Planctomycetota bacterium]|jgi:iron(III) transport system permease protein